MEQCRACLVSFLITTRLDVFPDIAVSNTRARPADSISFQFYVKYSHGEDQPLSIGMQGISVEDLVQRAETGASGTFLSATVINCVLILSM